MSTAVKMPIPQGKVDEHPAAPGQGSIFAIGDIHGCHRQLEGLLARLPIKREGDTLVFLGDYLDRGSNAKKVLDIICELRAGGYKVLGLLGNHEYLLLEYHKSGDAGPGSLSPEAWTRTDSGELW